jgi:ABC-2 type transport system ATP-binding protein
MSTESTTTAIDVRALRVTYPARRKQPPREAVRGLDVTIQPRQFVALLGPNGSGKSSLIRAVCGLVPFLGDISVHGESRIEPIRQSLGVVLQSPSLDPNMTVRENLCDIAALHGLTRAEAHARVERELAAAELTDQIDTLVKRLSGGLKRRVDLVRALLHHPRVLLLDEPTVGLDPPSRKAFLDALDNRRTQSNMTVLLSTHLTDEADRSDRVLFMHEGKLVADDPPDALRSALGARRLTVLSSSQPLVADVVWTRSAHGWTAPLRDDPSEVAALAKTLTEAGLAFTVAPPTLADAFESFTGATLRGDADA